MYVDAVDQSLVQCLNSTSTVFVECPPNYSLRIRSANVYKSASGCPSVPESGACWHSNVSDLVHRTCLRNESSCTLAVTAPTSPLHCSPSRYAGDYFVVVDHRCRPGTAKYFYPLTPTCCPMGTAIKHPVPDPV